jgi:hypothetical protein
VTSKHLRQLDNQYSLQKILTIWAFSAIPMFVLAFVITPNVDSAPAAFLLWINWQ